MENKTSKYFKYAIGEIILVVIGILIALQINNWNEKNKASTQLKSIITQIITDIKQDQTSLQLVYEDLEYKDSLALQLLHFLQNKPTTLDTTQLGIAVLNAHTVSEFTVNDASYQTLVSTGAVNQIKNPELKKLLIDYYTEDKWDLAVYSQRANYSGDYGLHRFKHITDGSLREHIKKALNVKSFNKDYDKHIIRDWEKLKHDEDYRIQLNKILALNIAYYDNLFENQNMQKALIEKLNAIASKQQ